MENMCSLAGLETDKVVVSNNSLALVARGCAVAAPCRAKGAEQLLEIGVKAGITGIVAAALTQLSGGSGADGLKAGALGAMTASAMSGYLVKALYGKDDPGSLSGDEKRLVSSLMTIAGGMMGYAVTGGDVSMASVGAGTAKVEVENNYLGVSEKSELEKAKRKLNSNDPAEREAAQKKVAELTELDISRNQKVIDACGNGKAASAGCATERAKAYAAKAGYETGPYNSKFSQQYPDAYGQLVGLLNSTTPEAQNQQKVTEALANYFMTATGVDYETALGYAKTKQGADIIIASVALGVNLQATHSYLVSKGALATTNAIKGGASKTTEIYFRVEGGGSGTKTSQNRIIANPDGSVTINTGCSGQLCVSTNGSSHASYYLANKRPDGTVVVFEIDAALHKQIMDTAIPQRPIPVVPRDANAPKIVDPGKGEPSVSLELPKAWDRLIEQNSSKARVLTKEEFMNEFGK